MKLLWTSRSRQLALVLTAFLAPLASLTFAHLVDSNACIHTSTPPSPLLQAPPLSTMDMGICVALSITLHITSRKLHKTGPFVAVNSS